MVPSVKIIFLGYFYISKNFLRDFFFPIQIQNQITHNHRYMIQFLEEKCYMYLNFYKESFTKMMWSLFIGTRNIYFS
jgi:hypothetical protein